MAVRQQALTVVALVRAELRADEDALKALKKRLDAVAERVDALSREKEQH